MNTQNIKLKKLFIIKEQLIAEIDEQISIVAESRPLPNGSPIPSLVTATDRYESQINRWIDKYLGIAHSRSSAYVVSVERKATSNIHRDWDEAEIEFRFPVNWEDATFTQLSESFHDYIINKVLAEFFVLTLTSKDPITQDKMNIAEESYSMIKHCLATRKSGTEKKILKPF